MALLSMPRMGARAILSALPVILKKQSLETTYRAYVTDALKIIAENTAKYAGGSHPKVRYIDLVDPKPKDTRSGAEIAADVIKKAGLTLVASE